MSADNTAQTILAGSQLTSRANEGLSNAIVGGFNAINNSIKMESDMMQQMVASTIDVRRTEIDEWYKKESLKLQSKELKIRSAQNQAEINNRKTYLDIRAKEEKRQLSATPFVTASKNYGEMLLSESKGLEEKIKLQEITISGGKHTDPETKVTRFFTGIEPGSPNFFAAQETLKQLQTKYEGNKTKAFQIFEASQKFAGGADPAVLFNETFSELGVNDNNFIRKNSAKVQEGSLLPNLYPDDGTTVPSLEKDMLTGSQPQEEYPSPLDTKEQTNSDQWDNLAPITEEPKKTYQPLGEFRAKALDMAMSVDEKTPYDVRVAATWKSWLSPEDQATLEKEKRTSLKASFNLIGASIIDRHVEGTPSDNEKIIQDKVKVFKSLMMETGEDPGLIDQTKLNVEQIILDLMGEEDMIALQEKGSLAAYKAALRKKLNEISVIEFSEKQKTVDPDAPKLTGAGAFDKAVENTDKIIKNPTASNLKDEEIQENGWKSQFKKLFYSGNELNDNFKKWIDSFDNKPEEFGIDVRTQPDKTGKRGLPFADILDVGTKIPDEEINALLTQRKAKVLSDPNLAYNFWLEKERKLQSKNKRTFKFEK